MDDDLHLIERDLHGEPPDDTETELAVVRAMLAAALAELQKLEWKGGVPCPTCRSCGNYQVQGHAPGCTLAAVLARSEGRG